MRVGEVGVYGGVCVRVCGVVCVVRRGCRVVGGEVVMGIIV